MSGTFKKSSRHHKLPEELVQAILNRDVPVSYEMYEKYRDIYSSKSLNVRFDCLRCGAPHVSNFKHLNKRTRVTGAYCPKCVMKVVASDPAWRAANSEAQLIVQSDPEQRRKNAEGVARFWRENPEAKDAMVEKVLAAQQTPEVQAKYNAREAWNGRGISGFYQSKWGRLAFDSSYELCVLERLEMDETVLCVKRGPVLPYEFKGRTHNYYLDFSVERHDGTIEWIEVKSKYIGTQVDRTGRLRAKVDAALKAKGSRRFTLITESNAKSIIGCALPRGTYRKALLKRLSHKIDFTNQKDTERYGDPSQVSNLAA